MTVTFCGHGDTPDTPQLRQWLQSAITVQIQNGATQFYLGGYGQFDAIAASTVWSIKKDYPWIRSVLVLAYLSQKHIPAHYDDTIYPPLENVPKQLAILRRNQWMVDSSDVVISCVHRAWGGAAQTCQYAKRKGKMVLNYTREWFM